MTKEEMNQEILRLRGELDAVTVCLSVLCEGMAKQHGKDLNELSLRLLEHVEKTTPEAGEQMGSEWSKGFKRFNARLGTYMRL